MGGISWTGFDFWIMRYDIENVFDFMDYMIIIKETISNFDNIYDEKINSSGVKSLQGVINTLKGGKK
jgi:hypothetical protein